MLLYMTLFKLVIKKKKLSKYDLKKCILKMYLKLKLTLKIMEEIAGNSNAFLISSVFTTPG